MQHGYLILGFFGSIFSRTMLPVIPEIVDVNSFFVRHTWDANHIHFTGLWVEDDKCMEVSPPQSIVLWIATWRSQKV
jgi:hypothetical protein